MHRVVLQSLSKVIVVLDRYFGTLYNTPQPIPHPPFFQQCRPITNLTAPDNTIKCYVDQNSPRATTQPIPDFLALDMARSMLNSDTTGPSPLHPFTSAVQSLSFITTGCAAPSQIFAFFTSLTYKSAKTEGLLKSGQSCLAELLSL